MSNNQIPNQPPGGGQPQAGPPAQPFNPLAPQPAFVQQQVGQAFNPLATTQAVSSQQMPTASARPLPLDDAHIDDLLRAMVDKGSSDLHLAVGIPPIIRVDGALIPMPWEKVTPQHAQRLIYDILTDEQIQRFETDLELDFSYQLARIARFRVNVYRDKGNCAMAFRTPTKYNHRAKQE